MTLQQMLLRFSIGFLVAVNTTAQHTAERSVTLMGSAFFFSASHTDSAVANAAIDSAVTEVGRIEALISEWQEDSETSAINRNAGVQPVEVGKEVFNLIRRSVKVSELTNGAFDITFLGAYNMWAFNRTEQSLPDSQVVRRSVELVDYKAIELDAEQQTVFLSRETMKIGFGAIGKGYAANQAKAVMQGMGIEQGLVNAGGDLICWRQSTHWRIGISDPERPEVSLAWIDAANKAVVTSGDYRKYFTNKGERFAHIIDPRTGWPAKGLKSVTLICPDAELADALATGVFVLGLDAGLTLINQLEGIECVIVDEHNELHHSSNIQLFRNSGRRINK